MATEAICCCLKCCCQQCCDGIQKSLGKQRYTKFCYLFIVVIFTVPAILVFFFINNWEGYKNHFSWMTCPSSSGGNLECIGASAVYRISLSFLALFILMLFFMLIRCRISMVINQGCFCIKYLMVLGAFIGFFFIGSSPFVSYSQASKYVSIVFMFVQSIILIDLFYLAGIKLVAKYDQGQTRYGFCLVLLTILFEAGAVILNVVGYVLFSGTDQCGNSLWVNIITSVILIALPLLQCLNFNKQNSLLTTAIVSLYISFLALICQFSYGGNSCTGRLTIKSLVADIVASTFIFIVTMYGSVMGGSGQVKVTQNGDINKAMDVAPTEPISDQKMQENNRQNPYVQKKQEPKQVSQENQQQYVKNYIQSWKWAKWHFYMCLASIYVGMLLTNWTSASLTTGTLTSNDFGFWVRVAMSWVTTLIYIWTLIAPKICPGRDFTVQ